MTLLGDEVTSTRQVLCAAESPRHVDRVVHDPDVAGILDISHCSTVILCRWSLSVRSGLSKILSGSEQRDAHDADGDGHSPISLLMHPSE